MWPFLSFSCNHLELPYCSTLLDMYKDKDMHNHIHHSPIYVHVFASIQNEPPAVDGGKDIGYLPRTSHPPQRRDHLQTTDSPVNQSPPTSSHLIAHPRPFTPLHPAPAHSHDTRSYILTTASNTPRTLPRHATPTPHSSSDDYVLCSSQSAFNRESTTGWACRPL